MRRTSASQFAESIRSKSTELRATGTKAGPVHSGQEGYEQKKVLSKPTLRKLGLAEEGREEERKERKGDMVPRHENSGKACRALRGTDGHLHKSTARNITVYIRRTADPSSTTSQAQRPAVWAHQHPAQWRRTLALPRLEATAVWAPARAIPLCQAAHAPATAQAQGRQCGLARGHPALPSGARHQPGVKGPAVWAPPARASRPVRRTSFA